LQRSRRLRLVQQTLQRIAACQTGLLALRAGLGTGCVPAITHRVDLVRIARRFDLPSTRLALESFAEFASSITTVAYEDRHQVAKTIKITDID
jgi:hypothetical protein